MDLTSQQQAILRAVVERIIPADDYPGAIEAGVLDYLERQFASDLQPLLPVYRAGLDALEAEAQAAHARSFTALSSDERDDLLARLESGGARTNWSTPPRDFINALTRRTAEGYYGDPGNGGNRGMASWRMIGFDNGPAELITPPRLRERTASPPTRATNSAMYDAIIVGGGAAGGIVAGVLAEAGQHVLLLERGRELSFEDVGRDHLRSQRLSLYGHNAGPDVMGNPRVFVDEHGTEHIVRPHEGGYSNNAACVGGGTRVYGAQAWRFLPRDFQMASNYGVPAGSSLADWPISYADLEPYYQRAEQEIGVAGDDERSRVLWPRRAGYPLPPVEPRATTKVLERGAEALGWHTLPVPLAINTTPRHGRAACVKCPYCVGFACPTDAKNGTHNTMIPRALATGNCELATRTMAERVLTDTRGKVTGVAYYVEENGTLERREARAKTVVVAGGAVESARLLLNSSSKLHPAGLGNAHDQVGRHLQGHYYVGATGLTAEIVFDGIGPGPSIATCDFNHDNAGVIGGGMLADDFIQPPIDFWRNSPPPELPRRGLENKRWMRDNFRRVLHVKGPVQEIPHPDGRVQIAPGVRDRFGIPVARLSGTTHPATLEVSEFMRRRAVAWLEASGCHQIWSHRNVLRLSGGQHQAGTCRMGDDPRTSVTDRWGRVHGHDNLYVIDGSLHVTNGGLNPVLTIMALAFRCADRLAVD